MQQIFFTPPTKHLELTEKGSNNFYCLGQIYVKDENYRKYAHKAKEEGRFIILDSGVGDHGKPISNEELFDIACDLRPNEVIPLDNLYESYQTIINCVDMADWLKREKIDDEVHILMCPQGDTFDEWITCYEFALEYPMVSTIGLSKKTVPHVLFQSKEDQLIEEARIIMYNILKHRGMLLKPIHLLGSGGPFLLDQYGNDPIIRSTDSCVAILEGINGKRFGDGYERTPTPAHYFDITEINDDQMKDIEYNIEFFKEKALNK